MTIIMEASRTTAVAERPVRPTDSSGSAGWASAAIRAHALLSQTMPDEELDALVAATVPLDQSISLPPFLFG